MKVVNVIFPTADNVLHTLFSPVLIFLFAMAVIVVIILSYICKVVVAAVFLGSSYVDIFVV